MIGIASRFAPWGRPFRPLDLRINLDDPDPGLLTALAGEELSAIALAPFVLTNTADNTVLEWNAQTVVETGSNIQFTPSFISNTAVLLAGESVNVVPYITPANQGNFSGSARVLIRLTLYTTTAYEIFNSTDEALLATNPAFKVSRTIRSTNPISFDGYAENN
jgi:hypothetical protein